MTQDEALAILKTGANVFLTGEPGSGKTYTVNRYTEWLRERAVEPSITASTGIAATHIGGYTIHSWSGIGVRPKLTKYDLDHIASNKRVYGRVNNARILIIDEVSMLSERTLGMVEAVCREVRQNQNPFGGLQVVFVGDFFQLPPIEKRERIESSVSQQTFLEQNDSDRFAFASAAWQKANPLICYLSEQHRQEDAPFLEFLSAVRRGAAEERHRALLRTRYAKTAQNGLTQLYSHNADVDHINNRELAKLPGQPKPFIMEDRGPEPLVQSLKRGCLSPETLSLKLGARVMFTKNDPEWRFVNGTTGVVSGFSKETPVPEQSSVRGTAGAPIVKTTGGREICAEPMEWSLQDGGRILARIIQVPLRLAWAITVHKSQGMSLDAAHMDLSDCFEYGQGYVALSRVRTLSGLSLAGLNQRALEVHPEIRARDAHFRAASDVAQQKFSALPPSELAKMHDNFIRAIGGKKPVGTEQRGAKREMFGPETRYPRYPFRHGDDTEKRWEKTRALLAEGKTVFDVARERGRTVQTIFEHLEALCEQNQLTREQIIHLKPDADRFAAIERAFAAVLAQTPQDGQDTRRDSRGKVKLAPVRELLGDSYSYDELRLARLFIKFND